MEDFLSRYRNLTVLLLVVFGQLVYLAYQVKTNRDERLIRVWAVTAVTPMAGIVEGIRRNTIGFLEDYFILLDVREQNRRLKNENDRLRMENVYFRNQLSTAEHARALAMFQAQSPSKTVPARVIGNSTVATAKAVFIDRGSASGIEKGMAVVTPEGIVGKVVAVYPLVSQVLLVTDPTFKVGVESQRGHVHGVLNCGSGKCVVEQIQNEEKIDNGEWFFTSGEDRIFPKGFPVGVVTSAQPGNGMKDVHLSLSGAPAGAEEVLVVLHAVHQAIPSERPTLQTGIEVPPPPPETATPTTTAVKPQTEADRVVEKYVEIGKRQEHAYGAVGSAIPNFNVKTEAPVSGTNPAPPVVANPTPPVLGARPGPPSSTVPRAGTPAPQPTNTAPRAPKLPLGAPRPKPNQTSTGTPSNQPPSQ